MNQNKSIGILLKSEVKHINYEYTAGCERVFLQDTSLLINKGYAVTSYTSCQELNLPPSLATHVKVLHYPHRLLEIIEKIHHRNNFSKLNLIFYALYRSIGYLADFFYVLQFLAHQKNAELFYVFEQPLVALFYPNKTILSYHNFDKRHKSIPSLTLLFNYLSIFKKTNKIEILFVSRSLRNQFLNVFRVFEENIKTHVVYNNADKNLFKYKKKTNIQKIKFLYPSVWIKKKGIFIIPQIISEVNKKFSDSVEFVICGSIDLWSLPKFIYQDYEKINKLVTTLANKYSNVKIERTQYKVMNKKYQDATFTLFPSIWNEPFSLAIIESLSCGTPVISFNIGGTKEIIENNVNGYLVNKISPKAYVAKVLSIIEQFNKDEYLKLSLAAKESTSNSRLENRNDKMSKIIFDKLNI